MNANILAAAAAACGKNYLTISGGDGEREQDPNTGEQDPQNQGEPDNSGEPDLQPSQEDNKQDAGKSSGPTLEEQLDAQKAENIRINKENERLKNAATKSKEDKDAAAERDEYKAKYEQLDGLLSSKFLAWSIDTFTDSKGNKVYDWENSEDVRLLIKPDEIDIDLNTGEVNGLDLALKRIAKERPHWLKKVKKENEQQGPPNPISGGHPHGGTVSTDQAEQNRIATKYKIGAPNLKVM